MSRQGGAVSTILNLPDRNQHRISISKPARGVLSRRRYNEPMDGSDRVNPASPGQKLTYDDFLLFPDDGKRHELIDGEHCVAASPNLRHQRIVGNVFAAIDGWLQ